MSIPKYNEYWTEVDAMDDKIQERLEQIHVDHFIPEDDCLLCLSESEPIKKIADGIGGIREDLQRLMEKKQKHEAA